MIIKVLKLNDALDVMAFMKAILDISLIIIFQHIMGESQYLVFYISMLFFFFFF